LALPAFSEPAWAYVDPSVMNSYIEEPLQAIVDQIEESYTINSFNIEDGYAVVEVTKK